jgi:hypothetical protein
VKKSDADLRKLHRTTKLSGNLRNLLMYESRSKEACSEFC